MVLVHFTRRRQDLPFKWMFWMFGAFIVGCGTTHLMEVITTYWPAYRLAGVVKVFTAGVSLVTAFFLVPLVPKALALRSPRELEEEIRQRQRAEGELRRAHDELDARVRERTAELEAANTALRAEVAERERAEGSLRQSEARFRQLADAMPQIVWTARPDGVLDYYNERWYEFTGFPRGEYGDQSWEPILHPDDVRHCHDTWYESVRSGQPYNIEYRFKDRRTGGYRWHLGRAVPVRDEAGNVVRWFGTCTDIDDTKRAEEEVRGLNRTLEDRVAERTAELARQTLVLRSTLDGISEGLIVADRDGRIVLFNPAAGRILRARPPSGDPGDWPGTDTLYLPDRVTPYPPDELPLARALRGEELDDAEVVVRPGGTGPVTWLVCDARPLRDDRGTLQGGLVVFRDITDRKRAEDALRESEERFQAFMNHTPAVAFMKDEGGRIAYINGTYEREFGVRQADLLGKTDFDWLPEETARQVRRNDEAVLASGAALEVMETVPTPDGTPRHWLSLKFPFRDAAGRAFVGGVAVDLTDRQRAQEELQRLTAELRRSNQELQDFAYVASHDLQEPLRKIQQFGDLLEEECAAALPEAGRDYVRRMRASAARMRALIDDLLTLARVTAKAQPFAPIDLATVAREVVADLEPRVRETGGRVEVGELPVIDADPTQMRQLLQNLVGNALKFHKPGEPPVVRVEGRILTPSSPGEPGRPPVPPVCELRVRDEGIGFDPRHLDRIFEVFQRLHGRGYEGTGIGLAVCRKVVERHGGAITADSAPGRGATFIVTLPLTQPRGDRPA